MLKRSFLFVWLFALSPLSCCQLDGLAYPKSEESPAGDSPVQALSVAQSPFHNRLLQIAQTYERYGVVDYTHRKTSGVGDLSPTHFMSNLSPEQIAFSEYSPHMHFSRISDPSTHGNRMYFVFSTDRRGCYNTDWEEGDNPIGQVIVLEAWSQERVNTDRWPMEPRKRRFALPKVPPQDGDTLEERQESYVPYIMSNGRLYHATQKAGLFIMFKMDFATPGTDEG